MAYLVPYCTVAFATSINKSDEWSDASVSDKEMALVYGRLFIDQNYSCESDLWDTDDYLTIPDEVQRANAILAEQHVQGVLLPTEDPKSGPIVQKKVKAGSVESETTYQGIYSKAGKKIDQKPEVTMILSPYCSLGNGNKNLIRV